MGGRFGKYGDIKRKAKLRKGRSERKGLRPLPQTRGKGQLLRKRRKGGLTAFYSSE